MWTFTGLVPVTILFVISTTRRKSQVALEQGRMTVPLLEDFCDPSGRERRSRGSFQLQLPESSLFTESGTMLEWEGCGTQHCWLGCECWRCAVLAERTRTSTLQQW